MMTNSRRNFIKTAGATGLVMAGVMGLAACAGPARRIKEEHFGLNLTLNALQLANGQQIGVDRVNVNGIFAGRPIIEQVGTAPIKYQETRSKLWHASPADLVRDGIITGWNNAAGRTIALSSSTKRPALKLELDLLTIGYDAAGAGFVTMRARVITDKRDVVIDREFAAAGPSASNLNRSVMSIEAALTDAINDIAAAIMAAV